jgi:autotransporter adhesin
VNANVTGAVALGQGAVADISKTVSVGVSGAERRIVNVAAGIDATDVVNKGQLDAVQTTANTANTNATQALANLQTAVNQLLAAGVCGLSNGSITCSNNLSLGAGQSIDANASNAVVLGSGAKIVNPAGVSGAAASGAVAIGNGAVANADPSVAIGNLANASGADAVAVGDQSIATGARAVAVGFQATASHANSVALGAGSVTSAPDTVSVGGGAVGNRRITNVAAPIDANDAATKGYVDSLIGGGGGALDQARAYTDLRHREALKYAARGVAAAMAAAPQVALAAGETGVGIGVGAYDGQSAIGIGLGHVTRGGVQLNLGVSAATGGRAALRAGLGWKW